jgi:hypothetical protein
LAARDGLFASLDNGRPRRSAFRPTLANALTRDNDNDLLLMRLSSRDVQSLINPSAATTGHHEESSDDIVDELLAEFAGVGGLFE